MASTFAKLSDDFGDQCASLSDAAFRLHVEGLVWSARRLLDCRIAKADLRRFATDEDAAGELVSTGWWSDDGNAYVINHGAEHQRTREAVLKQSAANKANRARGKTKPEFVADRDFRATPPPTPPRDDSSRASSDDRSDEASGRDESSDGTVMSCSVVPPSLKASTTEGEEQPFRHDDDLPVEDPPDGYEEHEAAPLADDLWGPVVTPGRGRSGGGWAAA